MTSFLRLSRGFALITALIFLVILTLVAVTSLRTSGLELRMSANTAQRTESFESSDSTRLIVNEVLDVHTYNRGWPVAKGGNISADEFDFTIPTALSIAPFDGNAPEDWYVSNSEPAASCGDALCGKLSVDGGPVQVDARYQRNVAASGLPPLNVDSSIGVFKVRTDISPGAGAAMVAGYEGTGRSLAGSGGRVLFYVQSRALDNSAAASAQESVSSTATVFRHVIQN